MSDFLNMAKDMNDSLRDQVIDKIEDNVALDKGVAEEPVDEATPTGE